MGRPVAAALDDDDDDVVECGGRGWMDSIHSIMPHTRERSDHNILSLEGQMCCKIKNGEMLMWDAVRGGWPL